MIETLGIIKKLSNHSQVIGGNVATAEGAKALIDAGADAVNLLLFALGLRGLRVLGAEPIDERLQMVNLALRVFVFSQLLRLVSIALLEKSGDLDNTIVVVTSDHGMPFPRCKSNNYDSGVRVPLAIRWPSKVKARTVVNDFVSLVDVAPTFYQAVDLDVPADVSGRSLMSLLAGKDKINRGYVLHGKERHVPGQELSLIHI